jgi:hypothetical protein
MAILPYKRNHINLRKSLDSHAATLPGIVPPRNISVWNRQMGGKWALQGLTVQQDQHQATAAVPFDRWL